MPLSLQKSCLYKFHFFFKELYLNFINILYNLPLKLLLNFLKHIFIWFYPTLEKGKQIINKTPNNNIFAQRKKKLKCNMNSAWPLNKIFTNHFN